MLPILNIVLVGAALFVGYMFLFVAAVLACGLFRNRRHNLPSHHPDSDGAETAGRGGVGDHSASVTDRNG